MHRAKELEDQIKYQTFIQAHEILQSIEHIIRALVYFWVLSVSIRWIYQCLIIALDTSHEIKVSLQCKSEL